MTYVDHFYMDYMGQSRYVGILQHEYEGITSSLEALRISESFSHPKRPGTLSCEW